MAKHYGKWVDFTDKELMCQCGCETFNDSVEFYSLMDDIQSLRGVLGSALYITSGYRCKDHPIEVNKDKVGMHTVAAVDIQCSGGLAVQIISRAESMGFKGFGVHQKGHYSERFVHLDRRPEYAFWTY